ncbi:hslU [Gossypium arboreum]|uniref:HslU n=1 Tax=Gossypium arboreum TaxID=29729 RepID=A0A0B0MAF7_GOSAR|nr:hslU [Gossypium arboreum]KHG18188.1 hslU [Gossypium arboreum]
MPRRILRDLTESGGTRKARGHTPLKELYELNPVERIKVSRNNHGQPVRSEARLLTGYLGIIAQNANILPMASNERFTLEVSDNYVKKALGKNGETIKAL